MTKRAAARARLSTWQQQAIADLRAIVGGHPDAIKIITVTPTVTDPHAFVTIRLPTRDLSAGPGGLRLRDHEDFIIGIRQSRLVPPQVDVDHQRFAGHPHVLQGHRLCIYLDPAREWDPLGGMTGFLERLWGWLGDAAAGRFDAATAMYHAVGGVLHLTSGTPTIVIREQVPAKPFQHAGLLSRSPRRLDMTSAYRLSQRDVLTAVHASGESVTGRFLAYETTGTVQAYDFSLTIRAGTITAGHQTLLDTSYPRP